jgi:LytS/YehU family sensor histidine kinase
VGDLRFQLRLVGWEEGARITAEREARFPRLPPGTYRFQVRAFVGEGPPSDAPWTELALTVTPAWYMRTGVQVVGIVLVMLALVLLVRIREQRLRMRQHLSQERVRYELDALRSQVDPHFLFNSFNDLVDLIESDPVRAVEHVERLSTFFRRILMLRDKDLIPLAEELEMLETYFALERSRFGEALALDVALEQAFMQHRVVPLTLQLLVENAIKHNVIDPHRPMVVRVEIRDGQLVVSNPRRPRLSPPRSTRFGLASIVQRYKAFSDMPVQVDAADDRFTVKVPLIPPAS